MACNLYANKETAEREHRILGSWHMVGGMELTITVFLIQWWNSFTVKA